MENQGAETQLWPMQGIKQDIRHREGKILNMHLLQHAVTDLTNALDNLHQMNEDKPAQISFNYVLFTKNLHCTFHLEYWNKVLLLGLWPFVAHIWSINADVFDLIYLRWKFHGYQFKRGWKTTQRGAKIWRYFCSK